MNCLISDGEQYCGKPATQIFMRIPACDECVSELESKIPDPPQSQSGIYT